MCVYARVKQCEERMRGSVCKAEFEYLKIYTHSYAWTVVQHFMFEYALSGSYFSIGLHVFGQLLSKVGAVSINNLICQFLTLNLINANALFLFEVAVKIFYLGLVWNTLGCVMLLN